MKRIVRIYNRFSLFWMTLLLGALYWIPSLVYYDKLVEPMKHGTYTASLVVMIVVFFTWLPSAFKTYWHNKTEGPNLLILAVFLVAFVFLQTALFRFIDLWMERPDWLYYSPIGGFISYQIAILGTLITVAVAKTNELYHEDFKRKVSWGLFIGGLITGAYLGAIVSQLRLTI